MYKNILFEKIENIAKITFIREKSLNALNEATLDELNSCLDEIINDQSLRVLIITGKGKAFVAGADITEFNKRSAVEIKGYILKGQELFNRIEKFPLPVIACVNGFALGGGCELAMACDLRLVSDKALFGQPEIKLGLIPGWGGTQRLTKLIGKTKSKELIFLGTNITAQEAYRIGLVNKVVESENLDEEVIKIAGKLARGPKFALSIAKEAIDNGNDMELYSAIKMESGLFSLCFTHDDMKEGVSAFLEKRKPDFS